MEPQVRDNICEWMRKATLSRVTWTLLFAAVLALGSAIHAHADPATLSQIEKLSRKAMESYDILDYEEAKKLLNEALAQAKTKGLENEPIVAKAYLSLGIIYFSGENDVESARVAFISAAKIDSEISIDPAYRTAAMEELLSKVKAEFGGAASEPTSGTGDGVDCASLEGTSHTLVDSSPSGRDIDIEAHVGDGLDAAQVTLYFRPHGVLGASTDFTSVKMAKHDGCRYAGKIPSSATSGSVVHYYIDVKNSAGKVVAQKGASGSPNIIEMTSGDDGDNPLSGDAKLKKSGSKSSGPGAPKVLLSVGLGSGMGYITGETEQFMSPVNCCFAPAPLHVLAELGYYLSPSSSISAVFRLGFPVGANIMAHAIAAPAGMVKLKHWLSPDGQGLHWSAAIGGGVIRQIVTLQDAVDETMDTDTTAMGPFFVGGGVGYTKLVSEPLYFTATFDTTVGIPVIDTIGNSVLNFGIQFDASVGLLLAF